MASKAYVAFSKNCEDIDQLLGIHADIGGTGVGRRKLEVLNKSALVLLTAFWEAYCEDVAAEGLLHLVTASKTAKNIPEELQRRVIKDLKGAKHELEIWKITGDGWKVYLEARLDTLRQERNRRLNTPKSDQIDELFSDAIGQKRVSTAWRWKGMNATRAREKLDDYIELRGAVAHRGSAAMSVRKTAVENYYNHLQRLVDTTDDAVRQFLTRTVRRVPWPR